MITHIEADRTTTPDHTIRSYCGRTVERHMDITGAGYQRVTYLSHTRHFVPPPAQDRRRLCRTCLRAVAPAHLDTERHGQ